MFQKPCLELEIYFNVAFIQLSEVGPVVEVTLPSCRSDWGRGRNILTLEITRWPSREGDWGEDPSQYWLSPQERSIPPLTVSQQGRVPSFKVTDDV